MEKQILKVPYQQAQQYFETKLFENYFHERTFDRQT